MLIIFINAYSVHVVVDIKPIYLNKSYLFQNKINYLDKIYLCLAKIKFSKLVLCNLNYSWVLKKRPPPPPQHIFFSKHFPTTPLLLGPPSPLIKFCGKKYLLSNKVISKASLKIVEVNIHI